MKTIVLGPPGTGKTWTLLNKVEDYLEELSQNKLIKNHLELKQGILINLQIYY